MGYNVEFRGEFLLNRRLEDNHAAYLDQFSWTRRMKRDPEKASNFSDPIREAVGLDLGTDCEYFVGGSGLCGQDKDDSIVNYNSPPGKQPSLWCGWVPTLDKMGIEWNEVEKFYNYVQWLQYLIEHFLGPWGYVLNGEVDFRGEDWDDIGKIVVIENKVSLEYR